MNYAFNKPGRWEGHLQEILLFIRKMNEPVIVIQTTVFTSNYNYRVVHVLTPFPQSIVHIC